MAVPLPGIDGSRSDAIELHGASESARANLARWLLSDAVQLSHGPERGGVAGSVDAEGGLEYLYPEITGYYLQWLAWQASRDGRIATLAARAAAAQAWLARWIVPDRVPHTRVYLRTGQADWRNHASFCFDLAMALRGLSSAARLDLIEIDEALVLRLARELLRLVGDDGLFHACVLHDGAQAVPDR